MEINEKKTVILRGAWFADRKKVKFQCNFKGGNEMRKQWYFRWLLCLIFFVLGISWSGPAISAEMDMLIDSAKKEGKLVLYTTSIREAVEGVVNKFQQRYGIKVEFTRKTTGALVQMIEAEKRTGGIQCDILEMDPPSTCLMLRSQGIFQEYTPYLIEEMIPQFRPKFKDMMPRYLNVQSISFNTRKVKAEQSPKTWKDLLDPKWMGNIVFPDPRSAATSMATVDVLKNLYGWDFLEKLAQMNLLIVASGQAVAQTVVLGEAIIGAPTNAPQVFTMKEKGEPIDHFFPNDGVPFWPAYTHLLKTAKHPSAAKLWIEFILSPDTQKEFVAVGYHPVRKDVPHNYAGYKINYKEADWEWLAHADNQIDQGKRFMSAVGKKR